MLIAVCDDEKFYREKVQKLLENYLSGYKINYTIQLFSSGEEFLQENENKVKFDIVFMDINMSRMDGIRTALQMRSVHSHTYIVLITAFIQYALEGYKVDAVRYIMKDTLDSALDECMDTILKKMQLSRINFSFLEGEKWLYTDNIFYVESQRHKAVFFYLDEKMENYHIYEKLDVIEERLSGYGFLRIHKSYLVNMKHICRISNYTAYLDNGEELSVPRLKYQAVKEEFVAFKGAV
ncbi:MAG: LytTR family DNA-binding domain-containing protein [Lachnospiraceae bacterium]|jgi:DNA-binding LytR/AlgR family response regulator|nr:hypothetical protein C819_02408 [Lachnospiraceae bacterium 10-1]MCX4352553.1 LytTR family DNA-binding domain-containing protein [Lachnospiraceae bacterium]